MPITGVAGGDINPSRAVKLSTTADHTWLQAGAGDQVAGISQKGTRNIPYESLDDGLAAKAGENICIFQIGESAGWELGGTVAAGDLLKSDANGKAVVTTTDGDFYGAQTPEAGVSGAVVDVQIRPGMRGG